MWYDDKICMDLSRAARAAVERTGLCFLAGMEEHGLRALGRFLWWSEVIYRISALDSRFIVLEINPLLVNASRIEALTVLVSWQLRSRMYDNRTQSDVYHAEQARSAS